MKGADAELCFMAGGVTYVDVVAAAATRLRIARHQRLHPDGQVSIWLPGDPVVAARYLDMLNPFPDGVSLHDEPSIDPPAHYTLLPATLIEDSKAAQLAGEFVFDACRKARISRERAGYVTAAVVELADNALIHAVGAQDPPVVAVNCFGRSRTVEVAVTDTGIGISEAEDEAKLLSAIPGMAVGGGTGFLAHILRRGANAGAEVAVEIIAGRGRLRWGVNSHSTVRRRHVPGMTVLLHVGA